MSSLTVEQVQNEIHRVLAQHDLSSPTAERKLAEMILAHHGPKSRKLVREPFRLSDVSGILLDETKCYVTVSAGTGVKVFLNYFFSHFPEEWRQLDSPTSREYVIREWVSNRSSNCTVDLCDNTDQCGCANISIEIGDLRIDPVCIHVEFCYQFSGLIPLDGSPTSLTYGSWTFASGNGE